MLRPAAADIETRMTYSLQNMRIRANFGGSPFAYAEGHNRHSSAESAHDLVREIRDTFIALPFHISSDSDSEGPVAAVSATTSDAATTPRTPPGPPCRTSVIPKSLKGGSDNGQPNISS